MLQWDSDTLGTEENALIDEVSSFQGAPVRRSYYICSPSVAEVCDVMAVGPGVWVGQ